MSLSTLLKRRILSAIPKANDNSLGLNQLTIKVLCVAFIASPPNPKTILPIIMEFIDLNEHPMANIICPIKIRMPNIINIDLYPYFTIKIPPKNGIAILGKE